MGTVISFPAERRLTTGMDVREAHSSAAVIILPVIRIERYDETPPVRTKPRTRSPSGGRPRRPSSRS